MLNHLIKVHHSFKIITYGAIRLLHSTSKSDFTIERTVKIINDLPCSHRHFCEIPRNILTTKFVENVLGHLFGAHSNGLKGYNFFKYSLLQPEYTPSSDAFEKTLHILSRMRFFDKAWELMEHVKVTHPSLLTFKSMSIMLSRIAKYHSYEETLDSFVRMERDIFSGRNLGTEGFNIVLRAFCTQKKMKEARSVFNRFHSYYPINTKTMNILLLGFKESGDITAVELFYHEMLRRGFNPNFITFNIMIDAYCKKGRFSDAFRLFEEMERKKVMPTLETITTLIHGAGVVHNLSKAQELFGKMPERNLQVDTIAYNALMSSYIRCRDIKSAADLMNEMETKNILLDNMTYHTMFWCYIKSKDSLALSKLYEKMINENFVPKTRTMVMLMKYFCENHRLDLGLKLWDYVVEKGYCPHNHALELLVIGLCSRGRVEEAFDCSTKMVGRGRCMTEQTFRTLERYLMEVGELDNCNKLRKMMYTLQEILPPLSVNEFPSPREALLG